MFDRYDGIYKATLVSSDSNNTIDYSIEVPTYRFMQDANLYDGNGQLYTFLENTGDDTAFVLTRWVTSIGSINSFIENTSHTASTSRKNVVARFNSDNSAIYISLNYTSSRRISICKVNTSDLTNNIS